MKKIILVLSVALCAAAYFCLAQKRKYDMLRDETLSLVSALSVFENSVIESVPVFDDFSGKESVLKRRFTYDEHMKSARRYGRFLSDADDLRAAADAGEYVQLKDGGDYYFYGVPKDLRYLAPSASAALDELAANFRKQIESKGIRGRVKIALSSAVRYADYQKNLRSRNSNAIGESSHSYGVSFDIFYDDFYAFPDFVFSAYDAKAADSIRRKFGYLEGDALRRQFKTVLSSVLLKMQDEKKIIFVYEVRQSCFHVTVLP